MITVNLRTNTQRLTTTADENTATPRSLFRDARIDIGRSSVNIDGATLTNAEMDKPMSELGVAPNETITLNAIVKADGARF